MRWQEAQPSGCCTTDLRQRRPMPKAPPVAAPPPDAHTTRRHIPQGPRATQYTQTRHPDGPCRRQAKGRHRTTMRRWWNHLTGPSLRGAPLPHDRHHRGKNTQPPSGPQPHPLPCTAGAATPRSHW